MAGLGMIVTIVVINIVYVSLFTVRLIFVMKGQRMLASIIGTVEVFIYLIGLNIVLDNIDQPINLIAYCLGFGTGVYLGSKIEEWLALGYVTYQIVVDYTESALPNALRDRGYGVTTWLAEGREGGRLAMLVLVKRSNEKKLLKVMEELAPRAFLISYDPRYFRGGFWTKRLHK